MNVLIVGYGSIGARHLRLFQKLYPQFNYSVLRRNLGAGGISNAQVVTDFSDVPSLAPDLVMICNPTHLHAETLEKLANFLRSGTAVFFEKPYTNLLTGIESIKRLVAEKKFIPFYGCVLRFHPLLEEAKKFVDGNSWGKILSYKIRSLSYLPDWRPTQDYRQSYSANSEQGGGVLFDLIHEFDYAEWFFGATESMAGKVGKFSSLEIQSDDYCLVAMRHPKAAGTIELSYSEKTPVRDFEIQWEKGRLEGNLLTGAIHFFPQGGASSERSFPLSERDTLYRRQISSLVEGIQNSSTSTRAYFEESLDLNQKIIQFRQRAE